jgi:hypothetical protein
MEEGIIFGTIKDTTITDALGSIQTDTIQISMGKPNENIPVRRYVEEKIRVKNQQEEHQAYLDFSDCNLRDKTRLQPEFKVEHTKAGNENGYYLVSCCYTRLIY